MEVIHVKHQGSCLCADALTGHAHPANGTVHYYKPLQTLLLEDCEDRHHDSIAGKPSSHLPKSVHSNSFQPTEEETPPSRVRARKLSERCAGDLEQDQATTVSLLQPSLENTGSGRTPVCSSVILHQNYRKMWRQRIFQSKALVTHQQ